MTTSSAHLHNSSLSSDAVSSDFKRSAARLLCNAYGMLETGADFLAVASAIFLANFAYSHLRMGKTVHYRFTDLAVAACLAGVCFVLILKASGAYARAMSLLRVRETEQVLAASVKLCFLAFAVTFWGSLPLARWVVLLALFIIPLLVFVEKHLIHHLLYSLNLHRYAARRAIIYGAGVSGQRVYSVLVRSPKLGLDPIAVFDDDVNQIGSEIHESAYSVSRYTRVLSGPITAKLLQELSAEVVIISSPSIESDRFEQISLESARANATLSFVPHDTITASKPLSYSDIDGLIFAFTRENRLLGIYEITKRIFDFAVTLLLLLILSPLLISIVIAIRLTSAGPALFVQDRVGMNGKIFRMFKFRTMYANSPTYACSPVSSADPRITRIGTFLRRTSLDELPQLLNVLKSEMSLVGPRPEMPFIVEQYDKLQRHRLSVKPGITGLWQLSADRRRLIHENIQYDLYYIRHRTFFMDLAILLHTLGFAMRGI